MNGFTINWGILFLVMVPIDKPLGAI